MRLTRPELEGASLAWLVELTLRGEVYRFATQGLRVPHAESGGFLQYTGTLSPMEYPDEGQPWDDALADRSIEVEAIFSGEGFAALAATDHDLGDATCRVLLYRLGDDYSRAELVMDGYVDEPAYSSPEAPVAFAVRESAMLDRGRTLSPLAKVTAETWPTATFKPDAQIVGEAYPLPFGRPGALVGGLTEHHGSPALLVEIDAATSDNAANPATVLLGDGELSCAGQDVLIQNRSAIVAPFEATIQARLGTDGLGRVVTTAVVDVADLPIAEGDEIWVSFRTAGAGGVPGPRGGSMDGAGDMVRWLLNRSTMRLDVEQLRGAAELLNGYLLAFPRNEDQGAWELAQDIVAELPASFVLGPRGLQLLVWRLDPGPQDVVAHLDTSKEPGGLAAAISRTSRDQVANVLSMDYALDPAASEHRLRLVYGPALWTVPEAGYQEHPMCSASYTRYQDPAGRPLFAETIQSDLVQDQGTAAAILHAEAMRRCGTHVNARFEGLKQRWQALSPGDVVQVSHAPISWERQICLVTSVPRAPGMTGLGLLAPNHWIRDAIG